MPSKNLVEISAAHRARLAAEIRKRRERAGLTWREVAEACGVHIVAAQKWGSGERMPEPRHLAALDRILG